MEAGISLAGGHSIDSPEPIFGLAVTGHVRLENLKRNDTATEGCHLLLTKPLGVGILSTAQKQGKLKAQHSKLASECMEKLNKIGYDLASIKEISAITDVTGFGLLGHLTEMCEGSNLSAELIFDKIPRIKEVDEYLALGCVPGGTERNWDSYGSQVELTNNKYKQLLCDPQTSGGLLIAVQDEGLEKVMQMLREQDYDCQPFGRLTKRQEKLIRVK